MPKILALIAVVLGLVAPPFVTSAQAAGNIAVVVHPDVAVDGLSFADLRKMMMGDRQFWSGKSQRVTLLIHAPQAQARNVLLSKVYEMSEAQFKQYWIAKVFRAEATAAPKLFTSNSMGLDLVKAIPGSIALVDSANIPDSVKVLKIDGKKPGESGYKLAY